MTIEKNIDGVQIYETPNGELLTLDDKNISECVKVLVSRNIKRVTLCGSLDYSYVKNDLDFFKSYNLVLDEIRFVSTNITDWSGLYFAKKIRILRAKWIENVIVDFSKINGLEVIWIDWNNKQTNLFKRTTILK